MRPMKEASRGSAEAAPFGSVSIAGSSSVGEATGQFPESIASRTSSTAPSIVACLDRAVELAARADLREEWLTLSTPDPAARRETATRRTAARLARSPSGQARVCDRCFFGRGKVVARAPDTLYAGGSAVRQEASAWLRRSSSSSGSSVRQIDALDPIGDGRGGSARAHQIVAFDARDAMADLEHAPAPRSSRVKRCRRARIVASQRSRWRHPTRRSARSSRRSPKAIALQGDRRESARSSAT